MLKHFFFFKILDNFFNIFKTLKFELYLLTTVVYNNTLSLWENTIQKKLPNLSVIVLHVQRTPVKVIYPIFIKIEKLVLFKLLYCTM